MAPPLVVEETAALGSEPLLALQKSCGDLKEARRGPVNRGNIRCPSVAEECWGRREGKGGRKEREMSILPLV